MTRRRDLEAHRDSLEEIGEILGSMKTLAYMETRKLSRFIDAQQRVVDSINDVAADFLSFHARLRPTLENGARVFLVIGSERGFCGDFNRVLAERVAALRANEASGQSLVVAVGHKLRTLLEGEGAEAIFLDGASVVEEVSAVLQSLIDELEALQPDVGGLMLSAIFHANDAVRVASLLPPFEPLPPSVPVHANAPLLNVRPEVFLAWLVDHYLFAALNHMLYASLMAENQRRVSHLDGAVRHLEQLSGDLTRRCRALRQEEIIEEIEVILLSAAGLDGEEFRSP